MVIASKYIRMVRKYTISQGRSFFFNFFLKVMLVIDAAYTFTCNTILTCLFLHKPVVS